MAEIGNPIAIFERGWVASGYGAHTYGTLPYEHPLEFADATPDFAWVDSIEPALRTAINESTTLCAEENELNSWPIISKEIRQRNLRLPNSFNSLIEKPQLQKKIPTCTGCFLSLSEELVPLPEVNDHYMVRFLNDSQSCFLWYLCLSVQHEPRVIVSPYFFEPDIFIAMEYEDVTSNQLVSRSYLCAETFLEFIFRFWLENTIWYADNRGLGLSDLQKAHSGYVSSVSFRSSPPSARI